MIQQTFYDLLNVSSTATRTEIRESYVRLKQTFSTNNQALYSLLGDDEAQKVSSQLEEAFRVLNDDTSRRQYDESVFGRKITSPEFREKTSSYLENDPFAGSATPLVTPSSTPLRANITSNLNPSSPTESRTEPRTPEGRGFDSRPTLHATPMPVVAPVRSTNIPPKTIASVKAEKTRDPELVAKYLDLIENSDKSNGNLYRNLRDAAGVSEEEIVERTKICIDYVRAIENNNYSRLPMPIFVKGFLRSYLKYLGVPEYESLVQGFSDKMLEAQKKPTR